MSALDRLAAQAAAFMVGAGCSPGSRASYQRVWDQFGEYCAVSGLRRPDREAAGRFCVAVGADGVEQWQVFYRRAVDCLFDVAETGRVRVAGRAREDPGARGVRGGVRGVCVVAGGRGLTKARLRSETGMFRRFLAFLGGVGVEQVTALSVVEVSAYVRLLAPMAPSSRVGQLYFLREYLRFAVREHGAGPALGAMLPVIVTDKDAVLPSLYRPGEVAGALAEAGNRSEPPLRDRAVMLLASLLGLRLGDIKGLRFDQVDWGAGGGLCSSTRPADGSTCHPR